MRSSLIASVPFSHPGHPASAIYKIDKPVRFIMTLRMLARSVRSVAADIQRTWSHDAMPWLPTRLLSTTAGSVVQQVTLFPGHH